VSSEEIIGDVNLNLMPILPGNLLYEERFKIVATMTTLMHATSRTTTQALKRETGQ